MQCQHKGTVASDLYVHHVKLVCIGQTLLGAHASSQAHVCATFAQIRPHLALEMSDTV